MYPTPVPDTPALSAVLQVAWTPSNITLVRKVRVKINNFLICVLHLDVSC